ncbi:hypothetical protein [Agrobacterium larrymoorei]|uniref:Capsular polysaccharide biosynthesis protein n=1 Tax=Agrobacterium larrymoorei TaxID=160699 RepID=A0AAF0HDS7_9HYPH|nr:hypothetical protein [Agrobacterium larrymoorei]WHA42579.1 hypothetical protein CFBP5477_014945 [Agrobacterium larrymoorei]
MLNQQNLRRKGSSFMKKPFEAAVALSNVIYRYLKKSWRPLFKGRKSKTIEKLSQVAVDQSNLGGGERNSNEDFPDEWSWYSQLDLVSEEGAKKVAILPSGNPAFDGWLVGELRFLGYSPIFVPLWDIVSSRYIEEIYWKLAQNPLVNHKKSIEILDFVCGHGCEWLMLPSDSTPFTRELALVSRQTSVATVCVLQPGPYSATAYGGPIQSPAVDCLGWLPAYWEKELQVFDPSGLGLELDVDVERLSAHIKALDVFPPSHLKLRSFGVGKGDNLHLVMGSRGNPAVSDSVLLQSLESAITHVLEKADVRDHIFLVVSSRKKGLLSDKAGKAIAAFQRVTVLFYTDIVPWKELFEKAASITCASVWDTAVVSAVSGRSEVHCLSPQGSLTECSSEDSVGELLCRAEAAKIKDSLEDEIRWIANIGSGDRSFECVAVPDIVGANVITEGRQRYLTKLLGASRRVYGADKIQNVIQSDVFLQWGAEPNSNKSKPEVNRAIVGRPKLFVEDGFVRSIGLWTDPNEPTLSIVLDSRSIYYDATRASLLETILNSDIEIDKKDRDTALALINSIVEKRISKYNYAPDFPLNLPPISGKRVLLVDQKSDDMSLKYGLVGRHTFDAMLDEALRLPADWEVLIKQHPCAIDGGAQFAHYTSDSVKQAQALRPIHLISFDINPYALFDAVDEVWVATSGMGFEALMAGKKVRCFGAPFYGGWGLTQDVNPIPRRMRTRKLEDIFHTFYVQLSRYVDPETGSACSLEDLLSAISLSLSLSKR